MPHDNHTIVIVAIKWCCSLPRGRSARGVQASRRHPLQRLLPPPVMGVPVAVVVMLDAAPFEGALEINKSLLV